MSLFSVASHLCLISILLGAFSLCSQSQAAASSFRETPSQGSDIKRFKMSKKEVARVDRVLRELIEEILVNGKTAQFLARYLMVPSEEERLTLDEIQSLFLREESAELGQSTLSRRFAAGWAYEEFPFVLMARTVPLQSREFCPNCCENHDKAASLIDRERNRILAQRRIGSDDFYRMLGHASLSNRTDFENKLKTLESIGHELFRFIVSQTRKRTFAANLESMKRDRRIIKIKLGHETVYKVAFKPVFQVVFASRGGRLKIIALGDLYDPC